MLECWSLAYFVTLNICKAVNFHVLAVFEMHACVTSSAILFSYSFFTLLLDFHFAALHGDVLFIAKGVRWLAWCRVVARIGFPFEP